MVGKATLYCNILSVVRVRSSLCYKVITGSLMIVDFAAMSKSLEGFIGNAYVVNKEEWYNNWHKMLLKSQVWWPAVLYRSGKAAEFSGWFMDDKGFTINQLQLYFLWF